MNNTVDKLLGLAALTLAIIVSAIVAVNPGVSTAMGRHLDRFVAETLQLAIYCMIGLSLLALVVALVWLMLWVGKRRNENLRQRDGSYPLQRVRVRGGAIFVDPNKMIAPVLAVGPHGAQEIFTADPDTHLRHAVERAKVAQLQALAPGDNAITNRYGSLYRPGGVFTNATGKHLAGAYDRPARQPQQKQLPPPHIIGADPDAPDTAQPAPRLTLSQAINRATPTALLAGQSDRGDLAIFNPLDSVHGGIIGSSGTGKTSSVGYALVAQALRAGYHVTILDPKGGADWSPWQRHAEYYDADPQTFPDQIDAIWSEHERRMTAVRDAGGRTIDDLSGAIPHTLVVIEEYGDLITTLRTADRRAADATDATLDRLMRLSRASGIHLLYIDQYPENWSNQVLANAKWLCVFRLGPNQGSKVREYHADRLPDHGRFLVRGKQYNAWFAAPHLDKMLAITPPSPAPRIIDAPYTVRRSDGQEGGGSTSGANTHRTPERTPEPNTDLQDIVWQWRNEHPDGSQSAMRRQLAEHGIDISRGYAHELWHRWPGPPADLTPPSTLDLSTEAGRAAFAAYASQARLPGGDKLGTDISH